MARFWLSVVALALGVAAAWANGPLRGGAPRGASPRGGGAQHGRVVQQAHRPAALGGNNHRAQGVRFSHGHYYRGSDYRHFRYRSWSARYRCWVFYDPNTNCWYYWSASTGCYYPLSYAPTLPPDGAPPTGTESLPPGPTPPAQ